MLVQPIPTNTAILIRLSTICWVVVKPPVVALMIFMGDFVLKPLHRIRKLRSPSHFPKHFTVSKNGCNSMRKQSTSVFPQVQSLEVEFGSRGKVVLVPSLNSVAIYI
jgi:hypothetical protein